MPSDARVERAADAYLFDVEVETGEESAVRLSLDRRGGGTDLAFDVRVIDRFSSGAALLELRDELGELFGDVYFHRNRVAELSGY